MIARALAIIEALLGVAPNPAGLQRIAAAFIPDDVDPDTLTSEQKAAYFVRGVRGMIRQKVLSNEEVPAINEAIEAIRVDVLANVDLGDD